MIHKPGGEQRLDSYQIDHPRFDNTSGTVLRPGCLPDLADWLYDDWIDLLGFSPQDANPTEIADELFDAADLGVEAYYAAIERRVSLCFFCNDGRSWEFYCHDRTNVTRVFEHASRLDGLIVKQGRLRVRDKRHA